MSRDQIIPVNYNNSIYTKSNECGKDQYIDGMRLRYYLNETKATVDLDEVLEDYTMNLPPKPSFGLQFTKD